MHTTNHLSNHIIIQAITFKFRFQLQPCDASDFLVPAEPASHTTGSLMHTSRGSALLSTITHTASTQRKSVLSRGATANAIKTSNHNTTQNCNCLSEHHQALSRDLGPKRGCMDNFHIDVHIYICCDPSAGMSHDA